jgi:imidazolonepropionase-like amidohydrolase
MSKLIYLLFLIYPFTILGQTLLVRAGNVLDVKNGIWRKNQTFLISQGRIVAWNPSKVAAKTKELDLTNKYLIPGLIDSHTHLLLDDGTLGKNFSEGLLEFYKKNSIDKRHELATFRSASLLRSGFTSVRDLGNSGSAIIYKLKNSNLRFFSSGPGHVPHLGQFPVGTSEKIIKNEYAKMDEAALSKLQKFKRTTLKLYADEDPNSTFTDPLILKRWTEKGHGLGLKVATHATFSPAIQASIDAGVDSIEHGTFATSEQFKIMAKKNIFWVPSTGSQILIHKKFEKLRADHITKEIKILCQKIPEAYKSGVKIAFGSDYYLSLEKFDVSFGEATIEALLFLQTCGLPAIEVIRAATLYPAELLGLKEIGRLEEGAWADFVVLKDDPLTNLSRLKAPVAVYLAGSKTE